MHENVFHKRSLIRWLTSPTCMLFHFLNISFIVCMHDHSLMLTLSIPMHSHSHSLLVSRRWVWVASARSLPHQDRITQSWEERLFLPLQKCAFLPSSYSLGLLCEILRDSECWPRKLRNAVTEPTTIASWDYVLCNSSNQQPECTMHCVVPRGNVSTWGFDTT